MSSASVTVSAAPPIVTDGHGSPGAGAERHGRQCLDRLSRTARWHEGLITDRDREHGGRRPGTRTEGFQRRVGPAVRLAPFRGLRPQGIRPV